MEHPTASLTRSSRVAASQSVRHETIACGMMVLWCFLPSTAQRDATVSLTAYRCKREPHSQVQAWERPNCTILGNVNYRAPFVASTLIHCRGFPDVLIQDRGPCFQWDLWLQLCNRFGIKLEIAPQREARQGVLTVPWSRCCGHTLSPRNATGGGSTPLSNLPIALQVILPLSSHPSRS